VATLDYTNQIVLFEDTLVLYTLEPNPDVRVVIWVGPYLDRSRNVYSMVADIPVAHRSSAQLPAIFLQEDIHTYLATSFNILTHNTAGKPRLVLVLGGPGTGKSSRRVAGALEKCAEEEKPALVYCRHST